MESIRGDKVREKLQRELARRKGRFEAQGLLPQNQYHQPVSGPMLREYLTHIPSKIAMYLDGYNSN